VYNFDELFVGGHWSALLLFSIWDSINFFSSLKNESMEHFCSFSHFLGAGAILIFGSPNFNFIP
jgi:hypothetical protein